MPLAADQSFRPLPAADVQKVLSDWGLVPDGYLLFMGTIEPRKNLLRLLQAAELAGSRIGPLVIAGADGWGAMRSLATSRGCSVPDASRIWATCLTGPGGR